MTGFFHDIRGLFTARFSGRYFSMLLREFAFQDPTAFAAAFKMPATLKKRLVAGVFQIEREWRFDGADGKRRRADLAILDGGEPVLVIEVKEDDVNNPDNVAQLADYLALAAQSQVDGFKFAHVSRYSPNASDAVALEGAGSKVTSIRYRDIHLSLSDRPFSRMLSDYLQDIGVMKYETIDILEERKEIAFFLAQILGFPHKHGLGKLHSKAAVKAAPALLGRIFGDLEMLGEWVKDSNLTLIRHASSRKFRPYPMYDLKALGKAIAANGSEDPDCLPGDYGQFVRSGSVAFYTRGAIGPGDVETKTGNWLAYELGFTFELEKSPQDKEAPLRFSLFAGFGGTKMKWTEVSKEVTCFPTEPQAIKQFSRLLSRAKEKAIAADAAKTHGALLSFTVPG